MRKKIDLFEIPIYALSRESLQKRVKVEEDKLKEQYHNDNSFRIIQASEISSFGTWEYNHIIGTIKIFFWDDSIWFDIYAPIPTISRYYWNSSKRKSIKRHDLDGLHLYIGNDRDNIEIQRKTADFFMYCVIKRYIPSKYFVDTHTFEGVNRFIDYIAMIESS